MRCLAERTARASCIVALVGATSASSLRSIRVEPAGQDGTTRVIIESNDVLPDPGGEALTDPPRIYLDFNGISPLRTVDPISPNPVVARVRVAEHSASPLVTRVVIDLIEAAAYRIDTSARARGRVVVIIGGPPRPIRIDVPPTAQSRELATGLPAARRDQPAARPVSAETLYAQRVAAALVRLHALKPLLEAIDRRADSVPGDLNGAGKEFDDVAKLLERIKPPPARTSTHALLIRTCTLGARAARLRESSAVDSWEPASAAAGALLMLERANGELREGKR